MNIDLFIDKAYSNLGRFDQLVRGVNDIMMSRVDEKLKSVSKILLVDLPDAECNIPLERFVDMQERHVRGMTKLLLDKSLEIENAVDDMLHMIVSWQPSAKEMEQEAEVIKIKAHFNWSMYQALENSTNNSLLMLKRLNIEVIMLITNVLNICFQ